jgi:hypothetical protein
MEGLREVDMLTLLLAAFVAFLAAPAFAADAGKPATTTIQGPPAPVQSDAVKPLTQPNVVTPPANKPVGPAAAPKVAPPAPTGGPAVSGPKPGPGAPAAGPTVPTIPAAGAPGIDPKLGSTIRDANQLDQIRDLKQLEQLYDPMHRGPGAAGNQGGLPRTLGTGRLGEPSDQQGPQGFGRDCLANPRGPGCIGAAQEDRLGRGPRDRAGFGRSRNRLGVPPEAAGSIPRPGGEAQGGGSDDRTNYSEAVGRLGRPTGVLRPLGKDGGEQTGGVTTTVYEHGTEERGSGQNPDGSTTEVTVVKDSEGNVIYRESVTDSADSTVIVEEVENATIVTIIRDGEGTTVHKIPHTPPSSSQPSEAPTGGAGNDGCNWAPLHGCLNPREDVRTTIRQRTTQPGINPDGQGTEGGGDSSRGGSTGPAAVTNTGDGSFGTERGGGGSQGTPIWQTLPDPARGGPGGPATGPGTPARRAGSDAGIDAGTGALPLPPKP